METKTIAQIQSEGYTALVDALGQRGCNPVYPELRFRQWRLYQRAEEISQEKDGKTGRKRDPGIAEIPVNLSNLFFIFPAIRSHPFGLAESR